MFPPGYLSRRTGINPLVLPPEQEESNTVPAFRPSPLDGRFPAAAAGTAAPGGGSPIQPAVAPANSVGTAPDPDSWASGNVVPTGSFNTAAGLNSDGQAANQGFNLSGMLKGAGGAALTGAKGIGSAIANNPGTALAIAQGIGGAISYATAKKPAALNAPAPYSPAVRGAQGMEFSAKQQARGDLFAAQANANQQQGPDVASGVIQRLLSQYQTGKGLQGVAMEDNRMYQADQQRVDQQNAAVYTKNYDQQRQFTESQYNEQNRQYEARRTQTGAMVQGAVNSVAGGIQQKMQDKQLAQESVNRQSEARVSAITTELGSATPEQKLALLQELKGLDSTGATYRLAAARHGIQVQAGGGKIPTGQFSYSDKTVKGASTKTAGANKTGGVSATPTSVKTFHDMSAQFAKQISAFSRQSQQLFHRSLEQAMRLRAVGTQPGRTPSPSFRRG